jgi:hypothetical protein
MSALHWPAYTTADIADCLRLAFASSPLAQAPEAHWRCKPEREEQPQSETREPVSC